MYLMQRVYPSIPTVKLLLMFRLLQFEGTATTSDHIGMKLVYFL